MTFQECVSLKISCGCSYKPQALEQFIAVSFDELLPFSRH